jgi:hypothetical protein
MHRAETAGSPEPIGDSLQYRVYSQKRGSIEITRRTGPQGWFFIFLGSQAAHLCPIHFATPSNEKGESNSIDTLQKR